ncbi:MAG: alpha/beta fold hydrolase [Candidatus Limnocylindrales bacterium]
MLDVTTTREAVQTLDGRSLDLYLGGPPDGDALLFHIGTPAAPVPYDPAIRAMAERGLRYVAFSRAGYGSSTRRPGRSVGDVVDDVATVLDHVGARTALTLGWSGGGPHALASAALLPDRIRAVATIGGVAPYPADGLDYLEGTGAENVAEFNAALEGPDALIEFKERNWPIFRKVTAEEVADSFGDLIDDVDRGALTGEFADWTAAMCREALRESYWGWFDDDMAFIRPWGFDLDAIRVPVHVWQGRHDRMVPFGHGQWLASHIPTAIPHLFDDEGHLSLGVTRFGDILDALVASGR